MVGGVYHQVRGIKKPLASAMQALKLAGIDSGAEVGDQEVPGI